MKLQKTKYLPVNLGKVFKSLVYVLSDFSQVEFLRRENFMNMNNVKDLAITNNYIEEIPADTFFDLANLEVINLSNNKLKKLDEDTFSANPKLKHIFAFGNEIEILENDLFKNNEKLEILDFDRNKLIAIKAEIDTSRNYVALSFRENYCIDESFPETVEFDQLFEEIYTKCYGPLFIEPMK
jgi:Leucine-rich repeat (LRR) protein